MTSPHTTSQRHPARRALRVLGWGGAVLLVLAMLTAAIAPRALGLQLFVINGTSMTGTIPIDSLVAVEPVPVDEISKGDVITFDRPDEPGVRSTHRVVAIGEQAGEPVFRTKGDNNDTIDPWRTQYVDGTGWRVVGHVPSVGRVLAAAQAPVVRIFLIAIPTLLLLGCALGSIWGAPRAKGVQA